MRRLLVFLLLCLPLMGQGITSVSGRREGGAPPCSTSIEDDFSGDLSKWGCLADDGSGCGNISGADEYQYVTDEFVHIYDDEEACTVSQWMEFKWVLQGQYCGVYFRSTNNSGEIAYAIRWNDAAPFADVRWRYCTGYSCNDIGNDTLSVSNGDYIGLEVEGLGNSTVVRIWNNGTSSVARGSWGTADVTMTDNPSSNKADTGKYVGIYQGYNQGCIIDDFKGGDF